jgi:hypothetical protein
MLRSDSGSIRKATVHEPTTYGSWADRQAKREGFELSVGLLHHRFSSPVPDLPNDLVVREIRDDRPGEVPTVVPCPSNDAPLLPIPPELTKVINAWPSLPPALKASILAMIEAASESQPGA